jgi:hypothetical protein
MKDYQTLLQRRAKHALPRDIAEALATFIHERNNAALLAWRVRWHSRHPSMAHPWTGVGRAPEFFALYFQRERAKARAWLMELAAARLRTNPKVLTLRRSAP